MNWLCWHVGTHSDPKFKLIARAAGVRLGDVLAAWAIALERAAQSKPRGNASSLTAEELAVCLDCEETEAAAILSGFTTRNLISEDGSIAKWGERQNGNDAQRKENRKSKPDPEPEAPEPEVPENSGNDRKIPATTHNNTEHNKTSDVVVTPPPRKREPKMALPRDWVADEIDIDFAKRMGLSDAEIVREQTKYAAYWTDGKGAGEMRTARGWRTTWQNRIGTIAERGSRGGQQHRTTGGNGFAELIRSGAIEDIARGGGGLDEAA
jgi:hypothetical protein